MNKKIVEEHNANRRLHLAYLFASPLVFETSDDNYYSTLTPISFKEEFEEILETINEQNIKFNYRY